jgi:hypothetical protein
MTALPAREDRELRPVTANRVAERDSARVPPQALDAERSVLGSMLLSRDAISVALQHLDENSTWTRTPSTARRTGRSGAPSSGSRTARARSTC